MREDFRPFGGSVLDTHANRYFNLSDNFDYLYTNSTCYVKNAFKKIKMFNKRKLKFETNNSYKKIFRFEDSNHRNLAAAKDELHNTLKELSEEDIHSQMQSMFRSREEFRASQEDLEEELFGKEKTVEEDKS